MPRPARPWFRFYTEALHDPKLRRMPAGHRWVWVAVLGAARQSCDPGVLLVSESQPMDEHDLADLSAVPVREVRKALGAMDAAGMVSRNEAGAWVVTKWRERQFEADNTTERTRKHRSRERRRNVPTPFPGTGNSHVGARDALATESETDTDTQTSSDNSHNGAPPPDDDRGTKPTPKAGAALAVLARRDLDARQAVPGRPPVNDPVTWENSAYDKRLKRHGTQLEAIAAANPDLSPEALADLVAPPSPATNGARPTPLDGQQQAATARAERLARVATGEACQACQDTGMTLDEDGTAVPCKHP